MRVRTARHDHKYDAIGYKYGQEKNEKYTLKTLNNTKKERLVRSFYWKGDTEPNAQQQEGKKVKSTEWKESAWHWDEI